MKAWRHRGFLPRPVSAGRRPYVRCCRWVRCGRQLPEDHLPRSSGGRRPCVGAPARPGTSMPEIARPLALRGCQGGCPESNNHAKSCCRWCRRSCCGRGKPATCQDSCQGCCVPEEKKGLVGQSRLSVSFKAIRMRVPGRNLHANSSCKWCRRSCCGRGKPATCQDSCKGCRVPEVKKGLVGQSSWLCAFRRFTRVRPWCNFHANKFLRRCCRRVAGRAADGDVRDPSFPSARFMHAGGDGGHVGGWRNRTVGISPGAIP